MAARNSAASWWALSVLALTHVVSGLVRQLLAFLSIVIAEQCESQCTDAEFVSTCESCVDFDRSCDACYYCRLRDGSDYYNLRDGACVSASDYGLLTGAGFFVPYALAMLASGHLADRYNRKLLLSAALVLLGLGGALQGWVSDFGGMFAARAMLGVGAALATPPSYSLITDLFSEESRGSAVGVFVAGLYVGQGLASLSMPLALDQGWRDAAEVLSLAGAGTCLGLLLLTVREPERSAPASASASASAPAEQAPTVAALARDPVLLWLLLGCVARNLAAQAVLAFLPVFYSTLFPTYADEFAVSNVVVFAVGGSISAFGTGAITDVLARRVSNNARAWTPALASVLCAVLFAAAMSVDDFWSSQAFFFANIVVGEGWFAPMAAIMQQRVGSARAGSAVALYVATGTLVGNVAPTAMGVLITDPDWDVQSLLLVFAVPSLAVAGVAFALAARAAGAEGAGLASPLIASGSGAKVLDMGMPAEAVMSLTPRSEGRRL